MKLSHRCILTAFIISFSLICVRHSMTSEMPLAPFGLLLKVFSYSAEESVTIRSEGGSQADEGNVAAAKEDAIQNALRKAVRSHVSELVNLSKSESDELLPDIEANLSDYVVEYEVSKETVQNDIIRVILDVRIMPERLVKHILDRGFLKAFRHKPRIMIALPSEQKALIAALKKGFIDLGFHVVDSARRGRQLNSALESGDTDAVVEIGRELGSDLAITGETDSTVLESSQLGNFKSWRIEASLEAIRCDGAQVLDAGNFEGVALGLSEIVGMRKAAEKLAPNVIRDFPNRIIEIWVTGVATGTITPKPFPGGGPPPVITVTSPVDKDITAESAIRVVGTVEDDEGVEEVKLFSNGASLALDRDLHITPCGQDARAPTEVNAISINRKVPLKPGENIISILAFDEDENKAEKELKVFYDPSRKEEAEDSAIRILVYTPADDEVTDDIFVSVKGEIISRESIASVSISAHGLELPARFDEVAVGKIPHTPEETRKLYRMHRLVPLSEKRNVIEITAQSVSGAEGKRYIAVSTKDVRKLTQPWGKSPTPLGTQMVIYEPEDGLTTAETTVPLSGEILADAGIAEVVVFNNGKELIRKSDLRLVSDSLPYKILELEESLNLEEGENRIEIELCPEQGASVKRIITVKRTKEVPVRIEIESPLLDQRYFSENIEVIGEVIGSVPIQEQVEITVNGKEPASSRGMRLVRPIPEKENKVHIPINEKISLAPGPNEIEITAITEANQQFRKRISVSYSPNPGFQLGQIEDVREKYAVIVGIGKYHDPDIASLRFARIDAESVYQFLTEPEGGGFPRENVRMLVDEQATREAIMEAIGEWLPSQVEPDDIVLLYYAGHGGVEVDLTGEEPDGNSKYLIPYDAKLGNLFSTAILNSTMTTMLQRIHSNQMIFLIDCCYSGGSTSGEEVIRSVSLPSATVGTDVYNDFSGSGRVVISASLSDQPSFELPQLNHGLFTYNLLKGVSGSADFNRNGFITLISELYMFVSEEVSKMARSYGREQKTTLKCGIQGGDLVLSKVIEVVR